MMIAHNNQRYRRVTSRARGVLLWLGAISLLAGVHCGDPNGLTRQKQRSNPRDRFGRTYYIDGAGNWGFGVADIANGLTHAGYKGNIINYRWSPTLNPALDQTIGRPAARAKGKALGREINDYLQSNPEATVNIIALSAGTGVGIWACEAVESPAKVKDIVLLGSSLSSTYDVSTALSHISGGIYVYHSPNDMVLQGPVRTLGTIDGEMGVESAGTVGLHPHKGDRNRIHNIPWSPRYEAYGWTGAHTDATCEPFVRHVIAKIILASPTDSAPLSEAESNHDQSPDSLAGIVRISHHGDTENTEKMNEFKHFSGRLAPSDGFQTAAPSFVLNDLVLRDLRASVVNLQKISRTASR